MAKNVNTMETQPGVVRWQIADAVVYQGTLVLTVNWHILARLEAMAKHVNTMETLRGVVRWRIADAVVRRDTQVLIAR